MAHNQPQILHQFVDLSAQALFNADSRAFLTLFVFDPTLVAGPFSSSHLLLQRELQAIYDRARRQHPNERDGQAAARYRDALAAEVKKVNPELLSGKNVQFANLLLEYLIYLRGLDCAKLGKMQVGDLKEWIKGLQAFFPCALSCPGLFGISANMCLESFISSSKPISFRHCCQR